MFDRVPQAASRPAGGLPGTNCSKGVDNPDDDGDGDGGGGADADADADADAGADADADAADDVAADDDDDGWMVMMVMMMMMMMMSQKFGILDCLRQRLGENNCQADGFDFRLTW